MSELGANPNHMSELLANPNQVRSATLSCGDVALYDASVCSTSAEPTACPATRASSGTSVRVRVNRLGLGLGLGSGLGLGLGLGLGIPNPNQVHRRRARKGEAARLAASSTTATPGLQAAPPRTYYR